MPLAIPWQLIDRRCRTRRWYFERSLPGAAAAPNGTRFALLEGHSLALGSLLAALAGLGSRSRLCSLPLSLLPAVVTGSRTASAASCAPT